MQRFSIVGINFVEAEEFVKTIKAGTPAVLVREPTNQNDPNAVAVWIEGRRVGYVPKKSSVALAAKIGASGRPWTKPRAALGLDEAAPENAAVHMAIDATFTRSENSQYPQVQVDLG